MGSSRIIRGDVCVVVGVFWCVLVFLLLVFLEDLQWIREPCWNFFRRLGVYGRAPGSTNIDLLAKSIKETTPSHINLHHLVSSSLSSHFQVRVGPKMDMRDGHEVSAWPCKLHQ